MPPGAEPVKVQPDLMHLAFAVDDLEAFAADLKQKGFALSDGSDEDRQRIRDRLPRRPRGLRGGTDPEGEITEFEGRALARPWMGGSSNPPVSFSGGQPD